MYATKEIIQHSDFGKYSTQQQEVHFRRSLFRPTDKIRAVNQFFPTTRYIYDALPKWLSLKSLRYVGFTINPEFCQGNSSLLRPHTNTSSPFLDVKWNDILLNIPRVTIVVLIRTNLMKLAFSGIFPIFVQEKGNLNLF